MRPAVLIAVAAIVTGIVVGVAISSSGGGGPSHTKVQPPPLLAPHGSTPKTRTKTGTTGAQGTTDTSTTGGAGSNEQTTPQSQSGGAQAPQQDTPQNNVAPPKGSPADKFEKFCKQNPGACGDTGGAAP